jgi:hypothetical protein
MADEDRLVLRCTGQEHFRSRFFRLFLLTFAKIAVLLCLHWAVSVCLLLEALLLLVLLETGCALVHVQIIAANDLLLVLLPSQLLHGFVELLDDVTTVAVVVLSLSHRLLGLLLNLADAEKVTRRPPNRVSGLDPLADAGRRDEFLARRLVDVLLVLCHNLFVDVPLDVPLPERVIISGLLLFLHLRVFSRLFRLIHL